MDASRVRKNAYSASVPGKAGTCSCHVTFLPSVSADTVKKIALSLGPVPQPDPPVALLVAQERKIKGEAAARQLAELYS
jgi:hypothetical protein